MISFEDITRLFAFDLKGKCCIEIEFSVEDFPKYQSCWMGKMPNEVDKEQELYWYGLVSDGSEGYDYADFHDFSSAPIFDGKSLKEIWEKVNISSIDGCTPENRLRAYL